MGFGGNKLSNSKEEKKELDQMDKALDVNEPIFGRTADIDDSVDKEVQELFMNAVESQKSNSDSLSRDIPGCKELEAFQKKHKSKTRN